MFIQNTACFPEIKNLVKGNEEFRQKIDIDHHIGISIIELLIMGWIKGKPPNKLSTNKVNQVNQLCNL